MDVFSNICPVLPFWWIFSCHIKESTSAVIYYNCIVWNGSPCCLGRWVPLRNNGYSVLQESMTNDMSAARWLLFLDRTMSLEDYFSDIHVPVNCEFLVAQEQHVGKDKCFDVTLTEVFRVHWTHPLQTYSLGTWSSCDGFTSSTVPFDKRRGDLQGAVMQSGIYSAVSSVALRMAGNIFALLYIWSLA